MSHAAASPSTASTWLNCPASITKAAGRTRPSSVYAREGTAAHKVAEVVLSGDPFPPRKIEVEGSEVIVSRQMLRDLRPYIDHVEGLRAQALWVWHEQRVTVPGTDGWVWGTADTIAYTPQVLHIIDLKYGKGVPVDPGPQLLIYALGALEFTNQLKPPKEVAMTIIQPRLDPEPQTIQVPLSWLLGWREETFYPGVQRIIDGDQTEKAGPWCRWCVRRDECAAFHSARVGRAASIFDDGLDTGNL